MRPREVLTQHLVGNFHLISFGKKSKKNLKFCFDKNNFRFYFLKIDIRNYFEAFRDLTPGYVHGIIAEDSILIRVFLRLSVTMKYIDFFSTWRSVQAASR